MRSDTLEVLIGSGKQESTARKYMYDLQTIEKITGTSVDAFTDRDYNRLITRLGRTPVAARFWMSQDTPQQHSSSSVRGYIFALKRYWRSTGQRDKLQLLEYKDLPKPRPVRPKPTFNEETLKDFFQDVWDMLLTKEEKKRFNVKNRFLEHRNKFIVIFSYFFATRRCEIPLVKITGVDEKDKTIIIIEGKVDHKQYTELATSDIFWHYYQRYMIYRKNIKGDFLFPTIGGEQITPNTVYLATRMCDRLLKKYKVKGVNLTPHLMRRSLATKAAGELSLKDGMRVTRHKSVQAFQKYIDMSDDVGMLKRIRKSKALEI